MPAPSTVSVVVPMYDVAPYVAECVRSITAQDLTGVEVLFVDDGSTDGTGDLVRTLLGDRPGCSVLTKAQGGPGPGSARNAGLDATSGDLVLFCDGDDELAPGALAALRAAIDSTGAALAVGAVERFPEPRSWPWSEYFTGDEVRTGSVEDFPSLVHNAAVGNKMFRRRELERLGLRFAEGIHHQDTYVSIPSLLDAQTLALLPEVVQRYRKRDAGDSIMDSHFQRVGNFWDHLQVVEHLAGLRASLSSGRAPLLDQFLVRSFQGFVLRAPEVLAPADLRGFAQRAREVFRAVSPEVFDDATWAAAHRAAYAALLDEDPRVYAAVPSAVRRLVARRGRLAVALPATAAGSRAFRVGKALARLTSARAGDGHLTLEVSVEIRRGPSASRAVNGLVARLTPEQDVSGAGTATNGLPPARLVADLLPVDPRGPEHALADGPERFRADLEVEAGGAPLALRVAFLTPQGQASCGVTLAADASLDGVEVSADDDGRVVVTIPG